MRRSYDCGLVRVLILTVRSDNLDASDLQYTKFAHFDTVR